MKEVIHRFHLFNSDRVIEITTEPTGAWPKNVEPIIRLNLGVSIINPSAGFGKRIAPVPKDYYLDAETAKKAGLIKDNSIVAPPSDIESLLIDILSQLGVVFQE